MSSISGSWIWKINSIWNGCGGISKARREFFFPPFHPPIFSLSPPYPLQTCQLLGKKREVSSLKCSLESLWKNLSASDKTLNQSCTNKWCFINPPRNDLHTLVSPSQYFAPLLLPPAPPSPPLQSFGGRVVVAGALQGKERKHVYASFNISLLFYIYGLFKRYGRGFAKIPKEISWEM